MAPIQSVVVFLLISTLSAPLRAESESAYLGSQSCAATACHGRTTARSNRHDRSGNEYSVWARHDPHASSAALLESRQFREILERYSASEDAPGTREIRAAQCARCHDPLGVQAARWAGATERVNPVAMAAMGRGIGCESCHGPGREWIGRHAEPGITPETLNALGMLATKPLDARAQRCATCHVGGDNADMNHDMIAAGHPELTFEFAAYHAQLPKHWRSAEERLANRDFEAHAWLAGQVAGSIATSRLRASRAVRATTDPNGVPWPEFSEWSCLACHQGLRMPTRDLSRLVGPPSGRMVPLSSEWHTSFLTPLREFRIEFEALNSQRDEFGPRAILASIRRTLNDQPTWEKACQQVLALSAVERCFEDELRIRAHLGLMSPHELRGRLAEASEDRAQVQGIRESLAYDVDRRMPRALLNPRPTVDPHTPEYPPFRWSDLPDMMMALVDRWDQRIQRLTPRTYAP